MFRILFFVLKASVFAVIVLIIGNWVRWEGKTASDYVRSTLSQAEYSAPVQGAKDWARKFSEDTTQGDRKSAPRPRGPESVSQEVGVSEREKLKALIQELNQSKTKAQQAQNR